MAIITPFRGIIYKKKAVPDLSDVLAPPYDLISPEKQAELYDRHSRNVIRLILGKEYPDDNGSHSRYTRAAGFLKNWMEDGTLGRIEESAIYLYAQEYEISGTRLKRAGVICRTKIEKLGRSIFPHERTLAGPKIDRLNLIKACRMNFSQVFGIYSDHELRLDRIWEGEMKLPPDMDVTDGDGVRHQMWIIADPDIIEKVRSFFGETQVVIADGHHRYETALNYRNERRAEEGGANGEADYDYVMMYFSNACGQGFTVLPTHRIVAGAGATDIDKVKDKLKNDFHMSERVVDARSVSRFLDELKRSGEENPSLGVYHGKGRMLLLSLKKNANVPTTPGNGESEVLQKPDAVILQELVFEKALGVSKEAVENEKIVSYTIDAKKAVDAVDRGEARLSFLMNSASTEQVMEMAAKGVVMPQKSTYFYPKLITGLVFNPL